VTRRRRSSTADHVSGKVLPAVTKVVRRMLSWDGPGRGSVILSWLEVRLFESADVLSAVHAANGFGQGRSPVFVGTVAAGDPWLLSAGRRLSRAAIFRGGRER
jgi:hypothetical protein